jgi:isochorismate synthase
MISFQEKVQNQFEQKLPFVIYRKPNESNINCIFQSNDDLYLVDDFNEKGFVLCSFDGSQNILIPENQSKTLVFENEFKDTISNSNIEIETNQKSKSSFENLVSNGILAIKNGDFQKLVLSRKEVLELKNFDLIDAFSKLVSQYQSAFRYCFYHPKIGLWLGATPEQLLQVENDVFKTVALAGTQKFEGSIDVIWKDKEIQEQKFVTDFILKSIEKSTSNVQISEPFSVRAGNLIHLKSEISGKLSDSFDLCKMIEILHPTPAVCGLPKKSSKDFIIENENYNREFYTGFIGELNINKKSDLFVNLRCMKVEQNLAYIFVGCGITKDSIPEKEFVETINKSMTMKMILDF